MADHLGLDPARIERLRSPERLKDFDPARIWETLAPSPDCTMLDIGAGVGFVALPFARRFPQASVYGCDILEGMLTLLREDAAQQGIDNLDTLLMENDRIALPADSADLIVMAQLHHELDAPAPLLAECHRLLRPGATVAIVDWKDEDNGKSPPAGRRVPEDRIRAELAQAGFTAIRRHDIYRYHTFLSATA